LKPIPASNFSTLRANTDTSITNNASGGDQPAAAKKKADQIIKELLDAEGGLLEA
jgi:hypothetical protein